MKHAAVVVAALLALPMGVGDLGVATDMAGGLSIVTPALADDDDDDDGGGGGGGGGGDGGGGGGGGNGGGDAGAGVGDAGQAFGEAIDGLFGWVGRTLGLDSVDSGGGSFEPDEVLALNADAAVLSRAQSLGFVILSQRSLPSLGLSLTRLRVPPDLDAISGLQLLRREISEGEFDLNHIYRTAVGACRDERCYGPQMVRWNPKPAACPGRISIAMVDTVVDLDHPVLRGQRITLRSFTPDGRAASGSGHGTAVAALLFGERAGDVVSLVPGARAFAADVFYLDDEGRDAANADSVVAGVDWLARQNVRIINMSIAGPDNIALKATVGRLAVRGVLLVAAGGNNGPAGAPTFPAAYDDVIGVTAIGSDGALFRRANRGDYIDLSAPGVRIWSATIGGTGDYFTGTSFAAPFVTAAVAGRLAGAPRSSPGDVLRFLADRAVDLGDPGRDDMFGWGLVQAPPACGG